MTTYFEHLFSLRFIVSTGLILIAVIIPSNFIHVNSQLEDFRAVGVSEHNIYRRLHGTPPLQLDSRLNALAVQCAEYYGRTGRLDHSCPYKGRSGENIGSTRSIFKSDSVIVMEAFRRWYDEIRNYNYKFPGLYRETAHFTQLVWRGSQYVGIGTAKSEVDGRKYYVALYWPPGNQGGQFSSNVPVPNF